MPRPTRTIVAGGIYHVLNRAEGRRTLFVSADDYRTFINLLKEGQKLYPVDVLGYCLMENHWHVLLRPRTSAALSRFIGWVGVTYSRRRQMKNRRFSGHIYQGRFRSFPVQDDGHCLTVLRYVESNPLRSGVVKRAEKWAWSSLTNRQGVRLAKGSVSKPRNWETLVNEPMDARELETVHTSVLRDRPFGDAEWMQRIAKRLGLESKLRPLGRPHKVLKNLAKRQKQPRKGK